MMREQVIWCGGGEADHDWPGDLDLEAECARCGLPYVEWSEE